MSTLTVTKTYDTGVTLTETDLDNVVSSIETWANGNIGSANIAASGVEATNIAALAVTAAKIASDAVTTSKVLDANITRAKVEEAERIPTGSVIQFAAASAPTGWLACDGTAVSRTTYSTLFSLISTTYGAGDNVNTFNLPDFRRRVAVGQGGSQTFSGTNKVDTTIGSTGGQESHILSTGEMPSHTHDWRLSSASGSTANSMQAAFGNVLGDGTGSIATITTTPTGSSSAHINLQPSLVINFIIKY